MYLIDINVSEEINEYPSLRFQDIRKKTVSQMDGHADGQREKQYTPPQSLQEGIITSLKNKKKTHFMTTYKK